MSCPHGVTEGQAEDALEELYRREKATGVREWGFLCSCCLSPSGDGATCPACEADEGVKA